MHEAGPAPVITTALSDESDSARSIAAISSALRSRLSALRRAGSSSVMTSTSPTDSVLIRDTRPSEIICGAGCAVRLLVSAGNPLSEYGASA